MACLETCLQAVLDALHIDKSNIFGYTAWSFTDSLKGIVDIEDRINCAKCIYSFIL